MHIKNENIHGKINKPVEAIVGWYDDVVVAVVVAELFFDCCEF